MANSLCIWLSGLSGLFSSIGYNLVAYQEFITITTGRVFSRCSKTFLNLTNIAFSLMGIGIFVLASEYGPVSVGMPVTTGFGLLLNMVLQASSGMKVYTKSMCVGTVSLAAGAVALMDVGPTDPTEAIDVLRLVSAPSAIIWLVLMLILLVLALLVLHNGKEGWATTRMLGYAVLVADSTAVGATTGKMLTVTEGLPRVCLLFFYVLCGVASLLGGMFAARACDMSVYLPVTQSIQLVINALTGLCIWQDGLRIQGPVAYPLVFVEILLSVYLCSELNIQKHPGSLEGGLPNEISSASISLHPSGLSSELIKNGQAARSNP